MFNRHQYCGMKDRCLREKTLRGESLPSGWFHLTCPFLVRCNNLIGSFCVHHSSALVFLDWVYRPLSHAIAGHRLSQLACSLVSNHYRERKQAVNVKNLDKNAINGQCKMQKMLEQGTIHESNGNGNELGKRKRRGGSRRKKKVQVMSQESGQNTSNLGKRKRRGGHGQHKRKRN